MIPSVVGLSPTEAYFLWCVLTTDRHWKSWNRGESTCSRTRVRVCLDDSHPPRFRACPCRPWLCVNHWTSRNDTEPQITNSPSLWQRSKLSKPFSLSAAGTFLSPYRSNDAAHTTVHSFFFKKTVTPFAITFRSTIMNEFLLCCEMLFQIDESIFFEKKLVLLAYVRFF